MKTDDEIRGEDLSLKTHVLKLVDGKSYSLSKSDMEDLEDIFNNPNRSVHFQNSLSE